MSQSRSATDVEPAEVWLWRKAGEIVSFQKLYDDEIGGVWMYEKGDCLVPIPTALEHPWQVLTMLAKVATEVTIYDGGKQVCVHYDIPSGDRTEEEVLWSDADTLSAALEAAVAKMRAVVTEEPQK